VSARRKPSTPAAPDVLDTLLGEVDAEKERLGCRWNGVQILKVGDDYIARIALDIAGRGAHAIDALTALRDHLRGCSTKEEACR
jgi:hypothetical protein